MSDRPRPKRSRSRPHPTDEASGPEYEVGYGRPPRSGQFKPGQCGNPKGRPKKSKTIADSLERELDKRVSVIEKGQRKLITKRDLAARQLADAACRGDLRALRTVNAVMDVSGSAGRSQTSTQAQAADPVPMDQDDREILTAFAALIRSGGTLPDEAGSETASQDPVREDDRAAVGSDGSSPGSASALGVPVQSNPTRH